MSSHICCVVPDPDTCKVLLLLMRFVLPVPWRKTLPEMGWCLGWRIFEVSWRFSSLSFPVICHCHPWRSPSPMSGSCGPKWVSMFSKASAHVLKHPNGCLYTLYCIPSCTPPPPRPLLRHGVWNLLPPPLPQKHVPQARQKANPKHNTVPPFRAKSYAAPDKRWEAW